MVLRLCPRSGVVQTRPSIYSDRPRFRMGVTLALQVRVASSLLRSYCVPLRGGDSEPSALSTRLEVTVSRASGLFFAGASSVDEHRDIA
jgi:hypothetical protein